MYVCANKDAILHLEGSKIRMKNFNNRILAVAVPLFMIASLLFSSVFAVSTPSDIEVKSSEVVTQENRLLPVIIEEDTSLRGEYEKHFLCDDGSYIAIPYPQAVHIKVNGEWVPSDYTMMILVR